VLATQFLEGQSGPLHDIEDVSEAVFIHSEWIVGSLRVDVERRKRVTRVSRYRLRACDLDPGLCTHDLSPRPCLLITSVFAIVH
jgi:hypothetical protein